MPFYDSRPSDGWPVGSINDMNYTMLGCFAAACAVVNFAAGIWSLWRLDRGLGYSCKITKGQQQQPPAEMNSLSGIVTLVCATMYVAKAFDFFDGGGTPFSLNWYWYLDYTITCPLILLDFAVTIDLPYKLRYVAGVTVSLVSGVAAFVTPSAFRFGYFILGCTWFIPMAWYFFKHTMERKKHYPAVCQVWLKLGSAIFFSFWPLFPILFIFSWLGTGHISQQAFFIIHGLLDCGCKGLFGVLMTFFRLELEEFMEVSSKTSDDEISITIQQQSPPPLKQKLQRSNSSSTGLTVTSKFTQPDAARGRRRTTLKSSDSTTPNQASATSGEMTRPSDDFPPQVITGTADSLRDMRRKNSKSPPRYQLQQYHADTDQTVSVQSAKNQEEKEVRHLVPSRLSSTSPRRKHNKGHVRSVSFDTLPREDITPTDNGVSGRRDADSSRAGDRSADYRIQHIEANSAAYQKYDDSKNAASPVRPTDPNEDIAPRGRLRRRQMSETALIRSGSAVSRSRRSPEREIEDGARESQRTSSRRVEDQPDQSSLASVCNDSGRSNRNSSVYTEDRQHEDPDTAHSSTSRMSSLPNTQRQSRSEAIEKKSTYQRSNIRVTHDGRQERTQEAEENDDTSFDEEEGEVPPLQLPEKRRTTLSSETRFRSMIFRLASSPSLLVAADNGDDAGSQETARDR